MMEATVGLVHIKRKCVTEDCLIFDIYFDSKRSDYSATDVDGDFIGFVITNNKGFCKYTIEKLTNYWPEVLT